MTQNSAAGSLFRNQSRTFSLAAKLFAPADGEAVTRLYRFCRVMDDLADDSASGETDRLQGLMRQLEGSEAAAEAIVVDFLELAAQRRINTAPARTLAAALLADCGPRIIATETELIEFAYGVAGTVGLLMCPLIGADDPRAAPFAVDLGIALQMTNIARDITEDASRDRFYLPEEWVPPATIQLALAGNEDAVDEVDNAVARLLQLAESYYDSALLGLWFVPPRNRRAVFLAAMLYRAIGLRVRSRGKGGWRTRVSLGGLAKVRCALASVPLYLRISRREWKRPLPPVRDPELKLGAGAFAIGVGAS